MSVEKKRVTVTLTKPFLNRLDSLVKKGFYVDRQDATRYALRRLFHYHGMPLTLEEGAGW